MYVYDKMILAILLLIINVLLFINTREPQELTDVREKYRTLREHLKETNNQEFKMLLQGNSNYCTQAYEWVDRLQCE